jgi:hypothetical protein
MENDSRDLLSAEDIAILTREIKEAYENNPRVASKLSEALSLIPRIRYDPNYQSQFGDEFQGEDKKYYQAKDKIEAFFKGYLDSNHVIQGGRRRSNKKRVTRKKRNSRKRNSRKRSYRRKGNKRTRKF